MPFHKDGLLEVPPEAVVQPLADPMTTAMQKHRRTFKNLFNRMPSMADVKQGEIGDCYLLAAINAILSRPEGPELILHLMKDNGNGTVTIRLFKNNAFHYLRMAKTIVHEYEGTTAGIRHGTGKVLHNLGAVWVAMIEKAYAAFCRPTTTYKGLEGGNGQDATAALLGGGVGYSTSGKDDEGKFLEDAFALLAITLSCSDPSLRNIASIRQQRLREATIHFFPSDDLEACPHAVRWYQWNNRANTDRFAKFLKAPTLEKFHLLMEQHAQELDRETRELVGAWVNRYHHLIWPGAIGSGVYTPKQLDTFALVQRLLATQRAVTTGTPEQLLGKVTGVGHSGGESKVSGLAGKHEYSVVGAKIDPLGRRFLQLRNPWGSYGRGYVTNPRSKNDRGPATLTPVALEDQGEFWIELTDFTINFGNLGVGPAVHGSGRQALMTNLPQQLALAKARLRRVNN